YVSFINWAGFFVMIGKWVFKAPFYVQFDGKSKFYRRMIAVFVKFDVFHHIIPTDQIQPIKKSMGNQQIIKFVCVALLMINSFFGFKEITKGWPFACYPTFADRMVE